MRPTVITLSYEAYRDAWWERESKTDADLRAGIMDGIRLPYRYVGPPLVLTPEPVIERAWLLGIECRVQNRASIWLRRSEYKGSRDDHARETLRRWDRGDVLRIEGPTYVRRVGLTEGTT